MLEAEFVDDSSDGENINYLISCGIFPGIEVEDGLIRKRRGSISGKKMNKSRGFEEAYNRVYNDHFHRERRYDEKDFERGFPMPRAVFERIFETIEGKGTFVQRTDCTGKNEIHPLVGATAALRMLAYRQSADSLDEYLKMGEDSHEYLKMGEVSVGLCMRALCELVVQYFETEYLREPTEAYLKRILEINAARDFSGCIGSIDCQHW